MNINKQGQIVMDEFIEGNWDGETFQSERQQATIKKTGEMLSNEFYEY